MKNLKVRGHLKILLKTYLIGISPKLISELLRFYRHQSAATTAASKGKSSSSSSSLTLTHVIANALNSPFAKFLMVLFGGFQIFELILRKRFLPSSPLSSSTASSSSSSNLLELEDTHQEEEEEEGGGENVKDERMEFYIVGGAGLLSSLLAFLCLPVESRTDMALFSLVRGLDTYLSSSNIFPKHWFLEDYTSTAVFQLSTFQLMYAWFYHPDSLPKTYNLWIGKLAHLDDRLRLALKLVKEGKITYNSTSLLPEPLLSYAKDFGLKDMHATGPLDCYYVHGGMHGCINHSFNVFSLGFRDALQLYAPLNLVFFLSRYASLSRKNTARRLRDMVFSSARSSAFLGAFISIIWTAICTSRQTFNRLDGPRGPMIGTFLCGFSVLLEHPGRRRQLALYCLPKALESFLSIHIPNRIKARLFPFQFPIQAGIFSLSTTYLLYLYRHRSQEKQLSPFVKSLFQLFLTSDINEVNEAVE